MNQWTHFFIKIYLSRFILDRVDASVVGERWVERHILRERTSSHIFFREPMGANPCKPLASLDTSDRLRVPHSTAILSTLSKSDHVVLITWSPSGYTPVRAVCPDTPSSSCLLIKMWQLTKAPGVTRNEPKIHVICYITTKAEEPSLPNYLPLAGGKIIGFIPFPSALVLCEMQLARSRIWTRVAVSISYDDKEVIYTLGNNI